MKTGKAVPIPECRYCKVAFDQWERLVTHRRDEHWQEFEALKDALLKKQQVTTTTTTPSKEPPGTGSNALNGFRKSLPFSFSNRNKMKPKRPLAQTSSSKKTPSKEVDAKDLENKEVSLCVPTNRNSSNGSFRTTPTNRLFSTLSYPTPPSSSRAIFQNENAGKMRQSTPIPLCSVLTPPTTPSPSSLAGELVQNLKWEVSLAKKAILYHQIDDESEIEFCTIPPTSDGSRISLTRHSNQDYRATNGHQSSNERNPRDGGSEGSSSRRGNHVVIEKLEDELHITCSKREADCNGVIPTNDAVQRTREPQGRANNTAERKPSEILQSCGKSLKRLQSQLQLQHRNRNSPKPLPIRKSNRVCEGYRTGNGSATNLDVTASNQCHFNSPTPEHAETEMTSAASTIPRASRRRPNK